MNVPRGSSAVMAARASAPDALDYFPTPPWATRALCEHVLFRRLRGDDWPCVVRRDHLMPFADDDGWPDYPTGLSCWEPAAGAGHMAEVLREYFVRVEASDVHDYGAGYPAGSFVGEGPDVMPAPPAVDWIITNPPFNLALEFALRALAVATEGVALLVRSAWLETEERHTALFALHPPAAVAQFCERVPMVQGRWDPEASSATAYAWVVWSARARRADDGGRMTRFVWIPPGQRRGLTKETDRARFAAGGRPQQRSAPPRASGVVPPSASGDLPLFAGL
jgi:hypothetical protein